ncbi:universal stress protein [Streptomyces sp.]|uniref:universal stress protein n=1 Tax=Streptomyces sp. TaxID=1931 RepID=UPI002D775ABD|nr:universal stress protein [Streptomyces sp.]HET6357940.1 universal stress protein [Streptomyces sp.]
MEQQVVVGVDGSARSAIAADWAAREALRRAQLLRVVHVSPLSAQDLVDVWPYRPAHLPERSLQVLAARYPDLRAEGVWLSGPAVPALVAEGTEASVVVLGTHGAGGFAGLSLGSTAEGVADQSARPVVLVPSGLPAERGAATERVAVGIDARDAADTAIAFAFEAAQRLGGPLHAVHAWSPSSGDAERMPFPMPERDRGEQEDQEVQLLSDALRPWREKYPRVPILQDVVLFTATQALEWASARTDLLVVGRRGRALAPAVHSLLCRTNCPVAVVPS